jgi:transposase
MWGGFPKVIKEVFPNAKTVIDRFHVQKLINKNLNSIRLKLELKGLNSKNLLMTTQSKLTALEESELELILQSSPTLRIAHELKEDILRIYNSGITPNQALKKMKKWLISARIILGNAADTLNTHLEEICNYFKNRTTSGARTPLSPDVKSATRQWSHGRSEYKN